MTNTLNYNDKSTQKATVAALKHLLSTSGETKTMDEVFDAVNQQIKVSREQFEELFKEAKNQIASWENETSSELSEEDLDMVVGGGAWDWIKDHGKEIAIVAGAVLLGAAFGGVTGIALASIATHLSATAVIATSALVGGVIGGIIGGFVAENGFPDPSKVLNHKLK